MPSELEKSYGGYSTFRPQRNAEGDDKCLGTDECECKKCLEKKKLVAAWFQGRKA